MGTGWSCEKTWAAAPESVALARDFVTLSLPTYLLPDLADGARLVASELVTNAVLHAGTPFTLSVVGTDGGIELRVRDGSPHVPAPGPGSVFALGGRGLTLVGALAGSWGVTAESDGGKSVWARFNTVVW
jgi:anti-sigma regulatory factor (Ser/Thr protein kinase)